MVEAAIESGVFNDLGSGSNIDLTTIRRVNGKTEVLVDRNYRTPNDGQELRNKIDRDIVTKIPRGATSKYNRDFYGCCMGDGVD